MTIKELASRYIHSSEHVLDVMEIVHPVPDLETNSISAVVDYARNYLQDAKYYMEKHKFEVSLTSVAYCEGLLDALKLLGAVKFEWTSKGRKREDDEE